MQTTRHGPRQVLGEGLRPQGAALIECGDRGWPGEAVDTIKGFRAAELARARGRSSAGATAQVASAGTAGADNTGEEHATEATSEDETSRPA